MTLRKKLKLRLRPVTYGAARWGFLFSIALARVLSARTMVPLFEKISIVSHAFQRRHRSEMRRNLEIALGGALDGDGKRREIVRHVIRNLHRGAAEIACSVHWTPEFVRQIIALEGKENLDAALARGRGAIALTAHLGNFALLGTRLNAEGYIFHALIKNPPDERFSKLLDSTRLKVGQRTISARPRVEAAKQILRALRRNEIVLMVVDEFKHKGIQVEFFGRSVPSARGPATLALRSGAAVVPMFLLWQKQSLRLVIERPVDLVVSGDVQKDVIANTALFASCLERVIRQYPDQWNWLNVRWSRTGRRR